MNKKTWDNLYEEFLDLVDPMRNIDPKTLPENFNLFNYNLDKVEHEWAIERSKSMDMNICEALSLKLQFKRYESSSFEWEVLKQLIDDSLASENLLPTKTILDLPIIPRICRYPLIQKYNFTTEANQSFYVRTVLKWLTFIQWNLLDWATYSKFENGIIRINLSQSNQSNYIYIKRLKVFLEIIENVEEDYDKSESQDIAYELDYVRNEIWIKGSKKCLRRFTDGSQSECLFNELWENNGDTVLRQKLITQGMTFSRKFNDLIKDMRLVGPYGNLFIPNKSQDSALLNSIITHKMLKEADLKYIKPNDLTNLMGRK